MVALTNIVRATIWISDSIKYFSQKTEFYNSLNMENITDAEYRHAKKV